MAERVPAIPGDPGLPPPCYGLTWQDLGIEVIGGRRIRFAEAPMTDRFHSAWGTWGHPARNVITTLGFGWREARGEQPHNMRVTYWSSDNAPTEATMADLKAWAHDLVEADRLHRAETAAFEVGRAGEIRAALSKALHESWWAMSAKDVAAAHALVDAWRPDRSSMLAALAIVERARAVVLATAVKVRAEGNAVADADLCDDPDVRLHVHAACRYLSAHDGDHAMEANGEGWSKSTSRPGHWLSGPDALDARRAAIGLRLVRKNRRQLPPDLRAALGLAA